jgi:hypothetical protein
MENGFNSSSLNHLGFQHLKRVEANLIKVVNLVKAVNLGLNRIDRIDL